MPEIISKTEARQALWKPWTFRVLMMSMITIIILFAILWSTYS